MGTSGGTVTVGPGLIQIAAPVLPLVSVGFPYDLTVNWGSPFPTDQYSHHINQDDLAGKAAATVLAKTPTSVSLRVTATLTLSLGARLYLLGWQ